MEPGPHPPYGVADASYRAAGGIDGIRRLCGSFYRFMDTLPQAEAIRAMHVEDLRTAEEKLTLFLCGWLGGPKLWRAAYGPISIPRRHKHLSIGEAERDAWLLCMQRAVDEQPFADAFKAYLMRQLRVPAERVRRAAPGTSRRLRVALNGSHWALRVNSPLRVGEPARPPTAGRPERAPAPMGRSPLPGTSTHGREQSLHRTRAQPKEPAHAR